MGAPQRGPARLRNVAVGAPFVITLSGGVGRLGLVGLLPGGPVLLLRRTTVFAGVDVALEMQPLGVGVDVAHAFDLTAIDLLRWDQRLDVLLGLGAEDVGYLCAQSLFKYLPKDDDLLIRIADAVPLARFEVTGDAKYTLTAGGASKTLVRGDDVVVLGYMGDGATSSADFHVGLNFAGVLGARVVFFCQNNHWAISNPVHSHSPVPIAQRAAGGATRAEPPAAG